MGIAHCALSDLKELCFAYPIWSLVAVTQAMLNRVLVCRAQFVPQMVNSLTKLGMAQGGSNLENRSLAIDLCGVMVLWEERCMQELKSGSGQVRGCHQNLHLSAGLASNHCYE